MKKIPNIFKPAKDREFNNNKKVYYSYLDNIFIDDNHSVDDRRKEGPIDGLYRLSHDGAYIFNKKVIIRTKDKVYNTKIAGTLNNKIITLDGDTILLKDILAIEEQ